MKTTAGAVLLGLLAACGTGLGESEPGGLKADVAPGVAMSTLERSQAVLAFELVNRERALAGLAPLIWHEEAADVAYAHCVDMHLRGYYAHVSPEGVTPGDRMLAMGIPMLVYGGENIALGNPDAADVVAAWMASPGHRATILEPLYTHAGLAVHAGSAGPWWVQEFFTPLDR